MPEHYCVYFVHGPPNYPLAGADGGSSGSADAVPAAVKSTIEKSFVGSKLEKAWKIAKDEYKLEISKEGKKYTFFTDASGNIIKK